MSGSPSNKFRCERPDVIVNPDPRPAPCQHKTAERTYLAKGDRFDVCPLGRQVHPADATEKAEHVHGCFKMPEA
jgi:hypothetical protein